MGDYLIVGEKAGSSVAGARSTVLRDQCRDRGFTLRSLGPRLWLAARGPRPLKTLTVGAWILVGDVLNRSHRHLDPASDIEPHSYEKKLFGRFWGRFVGVRLRGEAIDAALRDPSGSLECVTWHDDDLILVGSDIPAWIAHTLPTPTRINFDRVGQALIDPLRVWSELLLDGPRAVLPGSIMALPAKEPGALLWRPDVFARRSDRWDIAPAAAADLLMTSIDEAVTGLSSLSACIGCEVSGGLDSSVVASSLAIAAKDKVRLWLNAWGEDPGADERRYVEDLARCLDITPVCVPRPRGSLSEADLLSLSQGVRPGLNALDGSYDAAWASQWRSAGVEAVMTGKGGDSVLIQAATADVFTDRFRSQGWRSILSPDLPGLARLNQRSVWSLIAEARRRPGTLPSHDSAGPDWVRPATLKEGASAAHPWLAPTSASGSARSHQIAGIASGVSFSAPSRQTAVVDVLHPLLAQPVVETALSLSPWQLTLGARDRGLVRRAFASRLPPSIIHRRSKGEMTAFYGRLLAQSLPVLRPWLLDGRLAREGLLDVATLDQTLKSEVLLWRGGFGEIMTTAALEGWVRVWEDRLDQAAQTRKA
ncbi:asparagine synthase-related protein [Brevundimonas goettingensis]|uniref:Asparagine synthetase domain-containing protein n=1 Tax=Brevundimonas goettingensis TaxID=2774190 RepID=A0A975BYW4_9CAUL|nr:asparagine synthase-related protein [Brevundimonas goettingensis]QTC90316.1 hypothetical protein IFJ75_13660 [Brevundimonas goettingensis]